MNRAVLAGGNAVWIQPTLKSINAEAVPMRLVTLKISAGLGGSAVKTLAFTTTGLVLRGPSNNDAIGDSSCRSTLSVALALAAPALTSFIPNGLPALEALKLLTSRAKLLACLGNPEMASQLTRQESTLLAMSARSSGKGIPAKPRQLFRSLPAWLLLLF